MKTLTRLIIVIVPALLLPVCATQQSPDLQLISPLGIKLYASTQNDSLIECLNTQLAESPDDISLLFQKGRALYGSQRFNEAIEVWTRCIHLEPENPVFFRRRGHRFISIRKFDQAIDDLNRADELNEIERSEEELWQREWGTYVWQLEKDIWYHLGLAYYLKKDYDSAADAYRKSCDVALTEDSRISSAYWLYLALCKSVRKDQAGLVLDTVHRDASVEGNRTYLNLCLLFKGEMTEEELMELPPSERIDTAGYGIGFFRDLNGDHQGAVDMYQRVIDAGYWPGFGYIAAEIELLDE